MLPAALMPLAEVPERVAEGASRVVKIWTGMAPPPGISRNKGMRVGPPLGVLRRRQQRLLRAVLREGDGVQAIGCAAARAETRHRLHELPDLTRAAHRRGRRARRIGGKAAELPVHAD